MYDFKAKEPETLEFWKKNRIYEKRKEKNKKGKKFYFLQGPPYTSGRLHIGHAWNNSMKDILLRYKRMRGMNVWDRAGYDMHGLPTENAVMKKLKLKDKEEIVKFGLNKFTKECAEFSLTNAKLMDADLQRLAIWFDYSDPYYPIKPEFIEGEWWLIKKAFEQKRLYKGKKIMHWCASCETSLSKHELEYENINENSIFLKFPIKDRKKEFLIVWTTTPWTIPFNLAVMVNPDLDYARAKVDNEVWIIAKELIGSVSEKTGKKLKIVGTMKGSDLEGTKYVHPMHDELRKQFESIKSKNLHSVILSKQYVTTETGSGLVHSAPGCGPEDYEVGQKYGLPAFNNVNEKGIFEDMGEFSGLQAKKNDDKFVSFLKKKGSLIAETKVEHEYAHCWRCHNPIIFRATEQWFMKIEDLTKEMRKTNKKVNWIPKWGKGAFDLWLESLKDNSIARQRFWGAPVPIWECKCGNFKVIGSIKELKETATTSVPEDLHRPFIDSVELKCNKCAGRMKRVPDVIDVWIDAGTLAWNCLYYPSRTDIFKKLFPADFILEATEQIKLWFSMLMICSTVALKKPCYKNVYMHGMILDYQGLKMSKSLGNIISPYEVTDKYGADILRYYMCEVPAGENINFNWENVRIKQKNLAILWNLSEYILNFTEKIPKKAKLGLEEKYILSRLNSTIKKSTEMLEDYRIDEVITELEKFYIEISRVYIQMIREKVNEEDGKKAVLYALNECMTELLKMFSIVCPLITESIYQKLKEKLGMKEESVHLQEWPKANEKEIDEKLEKEMQSIQEMLTVILAEREKVKIGLKWPLASAEARAKEVPRKELIELLEKLANIKKITVKEGDIYDITLNTEMTPELEAEGYAREIARKIQSLRKNAGLKKENKIKLMILADSELTGMLKMSEKALAERVNAKTLEFVSEEKRLKACKNTAEEKIKDKTIKIGFNVF
jgi:isoleucyl-tRNA synthetase